MAAADPTPVLTLFKDQAKTFLDNVASSTKNCPKWFENFKKHLVTFTGNIESTVAELEGALIVQKAVTDALNENKSKLEDRVTQLEKDLEESQQYSRRTNVLVHGVEEEQNEDTDRIVQDLFTQQMGVPLVDRDIARSHRLGRKVEGTPRPIIVRLLSYRQKKAVYDAKKSLKGTGKAITENLTKKRYELYKQCKLKYGPENVTTLDGRIFHYTGTQLPNGKSERKLIKMGTVLWDLCVNNIACRYPPVGGYVS